MDEVSRLHKNQLRLVASFGTGKPIKKSMYRSRGNQLHLGPAIGRAHGLFKTATAALTDCEKTHEEILSRLAPEGSDAHFEYFRFSVENGLGNMQPNEWKLQRDDGDGGKCTTLEYIMKYTERELQEHGVQEKLRALANQLVKQRRDRARYYPSHWERFACCTSYRCFDERCLNEIEGNGPSFSTRDEMRQHLATVHHPQSQQQWTAELLQKRLDECRNMPEFPAGPY
jgi:hypothetical protein